MAGEQILIRDNLATPKPAVRVGLISDTHVPSRAKAIPIGVFKVFENVDYIIHAGDIVELNVIERLRCLAPVVAVHGNMDNFQLCGSLPVVNSIEIMGWKIGVTHDLWAFNDVNKAPESVVCSVFDAIVFGHTHMPSIKWVDSILYINPGSPTNPQPPFLCKPSVGLLKITEKAITPEIIQF